MKFTAQVEFPEKEDVTLKDAVKSSITVDKVYVQVGHWVEKGETSSPQVCPAMTTI